MPENNKSTGGRAPTFSKLNPEEQRECLQAFGTAYEEMLKAAKKASTGEKTEKEEERKKRPYVLERVAEATGFRFSSQQFDDLAGYLYRSGHLKIQQWHLTDLESMVTSAYSKVKKVCVVAGSDEPSFSRAGARHLISTIGSIASGRGQRPINIGIMSGSTDKKVIDVACSADWKKEFDVDVDSLPEIKIFPLNGSPTRPEFLRHNAAILCYRLAEAINRQCMKLDGWPKAKAWGLIAPLIVDEEQRGGVDAELQTREILAETEPCRVDPDNAKDGETNLDIILTSVGERPTKNGDEEDSELGSIFYQLAAGNNIGMDDRVVGDLGFMPLDPDGEPARLFRRPVESDGDSAERELPVFFYTVARLPVYRAMTRDGSRAVILVARNDGKKDKVPALFAALQGEYFTDLCIDEATARRLQNYIGT